jgi:hypothetical protein
MNLTAALVTGLPFRQIGDPNYNTPPACFPLNFTQAQLLATNWEVLNFTQTITLAQLIAAIENTFLNYGDGSESLDYNQVVDNLPTQLGF